MKTNVAVGTMMVVSRGFVWASKPANIYYGVHISHILYKPSLLLVSPELR